MAVGGSGAGSCLTYPRAGGAADHGSRWPSATALTPSVIRNRRATPWPAARNGCLSRQSTAAEDHGLAFEQVAAPFFVDAAAGDVSLRISSPARASGDRLPPDVAAAVGVPPAPVDRGALAWPTLQLRVPASGSTIGGPAVVLATNVPDPARVTRVEYYVNRVGSLTTTNVGSTGNRGFGYAVFWNTTTVADGQYEIRAEAVRVVGTTRTFVQSPPVVVTVRNG